MPSLSPSSSLVVSDFSFSFSCFSLKSLTRSLSQFFFWHLNGSLCFVCFLYYVSFAISLFSTIVLIDCSLCFLLVTLIFSLQSLEYFVYPSHSFEMRLLNTSTIVNSSRFGFGHIQEPVFIFTSTLQFLKDSLKLVILLYVLVFSNIIFHIIYSLLKLSDLLLFTLRNKYCLSWKLWLARIGFQVSFFQAHENNTTASCPECHQNFWWPYSILEASGCE